MTFQQYGEGPWYEHKKTKSEAKAQEYLKDLREPEASYAEAQTLASHQGEGLGVSAQTLRKRLRVCCRRPEVSLMDNLDRYYEMLELTPEATPEEIKQAYRDLVKVWHPDRFAHDPRLQRKAQEKLKKLNEAYERLQSFQPIFRFKTSESRSQQRKPPESSKPTNAQTGTNTSSQGNKLRDFKSFLALIADDRCKNMITHEAWMVGTKAAERLVETWLKRPEVLLQQNQRFHTVEKKSGWRTRKLQVEFPPNYFAYVLLASLCVLVRHPLQVLSVSQTGRLCTLEANLPFTFRMYNGLLRILIVPEQTHTLVEIGTAYFRQSFHRTRADQRIDAVVEKMRRQVEILTESNL